MDTYIWHAEARFVKRNNSVYRTNTYLQWGTANNSLGCCLLLNPGSSLPARGFNDSANDEVIEGEAERDDTMKQLAAFVERVVKAPVDGRFHVYNLFPLRNPESENAIDYFNTLYERDPVGLGESFITIAELQMHPWMLIGWGCKKLSKQHPVQKLKRAWVEQVERAHIPHFGIQNANGDYYHPLPRGDRTAIIDKYVEAYNAEIKNLVCWGHRTRN